MRPRARRRFVARRVGPDHDRARYEVVERAPLEIHLKGMTEDGLEIRSGNVVVRQVTLAGK